MKTIIEPFRIKVVEPLHMTTRAEREQLLQQAHYNVFLLKSDDVLIDLLTDSGTSALSAKQMAAMMIGDESYAGSPSYYHFVESIRHLMPFKHIIPTHQGRAAERILAAVLAKPGIRIPNNAHFDTTRANFESKGIIADNLGIGQTMQPELFHPFKGNMDVAALADYLQRYHTDVPIVMLTLTNNAGGGQPVSMENIRAVKQLCVQYQKPLFLDSCRFAENAMFIKRREEGYANKSITAIVQEIFSYADGMTMSAKKDPFGSIGGWIACQDDAMAQAFQNELIISEGFFTYGGLAGRDLEMIAVGMQEAVDEDYLSYRLRTMEYFAEALKKIGIPIMNPVGGHALFVDAKAFLPQIPALQYPGIALAASLYECGGIRASEIGSFMFGKKPDGTEQAASLELLRLALPRRVYTQSHIDYVIECFEEVWQNRQHLSGYRVVWQPQFLRHFTARFERIT